MLRPIYSVVRMKLVSEEILSAFKSQGRQIRFDFVFTQDQVRSALGLRVTPTDDPFVFSVYRSKHYSLEAAKRPLEDPKVSQKFQLVKDAMEDKHWVVAGDYIKVLKPESDTAEYVFFVDAARPGESLSMRVVKVFNDLDGILNEMKKFYGPDMERIEDHLRKMKERYGESVIVVIPSDFIVSRKVSLSVMPPADGLTMRNYYNRLEKVVDKKVGTMDQIFELYLQHGSFVKAHSNNDWRTTCDSYIQLFEEWYKEVEPDKDFEKERDAMVSMCKNIGTLCARFDVANYAIEGTFVVKHKDLDAENVIYDAVKQKLYWIDFEALETDNVRSYFWPSVIRNDRYATMQTLFYPDIPVYTETVPFHLYLILLAVKHQCESYLSVDNPHREKVDGLFTDMIRYQKEKGLFDAYGAK